jgi:hypothetical protein
VDPRDAQSERGVTGGLGFPRVTFGIIVLNGEPFTRYCLRSLYPFAHEIIVVEGGHEDTRAVATPDGHSIDGTLDVLRRFCEEEDPQHKVTVVTRDGFWTKTDDLGRHRTHQSRAYAERATGDYLWQVDIDEFYKPSDMRTVLDMLARDPEITAVSFNTIPFWGGLSYFSDGWRWRRGSNEFHRLFKWAPGYRYVTHEPPTVCDDRGRNLREVKWMRGEEMARRGISLCHYDHLFPHQVRQKAAIYRLEKPGYYTEIEKWAEESYFRLGHPFHVERHFWYPSWIERYHGDHPPEVLRMMDDIRDGALKTEIRRTDDVERLLRSPWYGLGRSAMKLLDPVDAALRWCWLQAVRASRIPRKLAEAAGLREPVPKPRRQGDPGRKASKGGPT